MARMGKLEFGVFLPIGNNGFLMSETAPQYTPSFELCKQIALLAEKSGFGYVFSMSKWRGFGGATDFWNKTLESVTLMTGLAAVTSRVKIIATIQPLLFPPAVAAKMAATIDDLSNGRFGVNIVTGSFLDEFEQMGLLPPDYGPNRYRYADEWFEVVRRLWTEESVTFDGEWFHLKDCVSGPKPVQKPHPFVVCAGTSDEGFRFTAKVGNYSFIDAPTIEKLGETSRRMKATASEVGREIKTATSLFPIIGETDEQAEEIRQKYQDGADLGALDTLRSYYGRQNRPSAERRIEQMKRDVSFAGRMIPGSPATLADHIEQLASGAEIDSVQLIFADYIEGLTTFREKVIPLLEKRGLTLTA